MKIAFIGAGSIVFARNLLTDILAFPALRKDATICLEDIDEHRLDLMFNLMSRYKEDYPVELAGVTFEKTMNQEDAITGAKYVISAIQAGGVDAYKVDVDIPFKYGVTQCVGDSLGPGGVFRFLRTAPVFKSIVEQIRDVGYNAGQPAGNALFLNYTNPMAMNTWYCNAVVPDSTVGLCHGVQGTASELRMWTGATPDEFSFLCAGINHMAWFLQLWFKDSTKGPVAAWGDAYPIIREHLADEPEIYKNEKLRVDMMRATGFYMTESSGHLSEYIPYYRKREDLVAKYRGESGFGALEHGEYYRSCSERADEFDDRFEVELTREKLPFKSHPSDEYGSQIINAMETNVPFRFNGNVMNKGQGLITNLPRDCCVEVPIFADYHGLHSQGGIELPTICQALCTSNIMVQKAAVEGALTLNKEKIYHAVLLDPNTASVCSPEEVRAMVDELFAVEAQWLPQFG
ncbi:MAG TPA: alpha-galactosidase [Candidatus Lokiarchaeia archaeon]|nr:alpha-galactosidase [Candidatus Lokiarchaeia archaeon]